MEVRVAPSFTLSRDALSVTCPIVVSYDWSSTIVENLDYYPYGGIRIDSKVGIYGGEKNKYAGTQYDGTSGLNYMQARYQDASRGQFLSEDPVSLGDPRQQVLTDPQSLNSYSYANDNPITKSDPNGLWYVEVAASGAVIPFAGSVGLRFNNEGLNLVLGRGLSPGIEASPFSMSFSPGQLSHDGKTTTSVGVSGAYYLGGGVSYEGDYVPQTYSIANGSPEYTLMVGFGAEASAKRETSIPLLGAATPPGLMFGNSSAFSTPNYTVPNPGATSMFNNVYISSWKNPSGSIVPSGGGALMNSNGSSGGGRTYTTPSGAVVRCGRKACLRTDLEVATKADLPLVPSGAASL
jgi:RHS repeat-associated protein